MCRNAGPFVAVVVLGLLLLSPAPGFGQSNEHAARIAASVSSAFGDGGPAPAVALAAAVPVFSRVRLEVEGTFVRNLDFGQYYSCPPKAICVAVASFPFTLTGDAASIGGNLVAEVP